MSPKLKGVHILVGNYLTQLPLFVAKLFLETLWYEKDVYSTTADGGDAYTHDSRFLKPCLIYTCLSNQNKCLSFDGSDGRRHQNELCVDDSRQFAPLALADLRKYSKIPATALDDKESQLMEGLA